MKKTCLSIAMVFSLTAPATLLADTGKTITSVLLREKPSNSAGIVAGFNKGVNVSFTAVPGHPDWVHISAYGRSGYVLRQTVVTAGTEPENEAVVVPKKSDAPRVFQVVSDSSPDEVELQVEKKRLEAQTAELQATKEKVAKLEREVAAMHSLFPYLSLIERVEDKGEDVILVGIGKARIITSGSQVVVRLEKPQMVNGDKAMQRKAKERYLTGSGDTTRVYYVLDTQSIKPERHL